MTKHIQIGAAEAQPAGAEGAEHGKHSTSALILGSIGVVYGDIGTSPLYALRESLSHSVKADALTEEAVIGAISLLILALVFTVTLKYVLFLMRADNRGEGGTLSLMALAESSVGGRSLAIFLLGVAGAALFSGDAIITPAISVLSAVEGLELVTHRFSDYVLPITLFILITLFWVQSHGTARVATLFGPIMVVFFAAIGALGAMHIGDAPQVLWAFDPRTGVSFLLNHGWLGFAILGSVFLGVTGAEALYADMGHFGRFPIQAAWLGFVLPALLLNYLGQGALILSNPEAVNNPFFLLAPDWALLPLVLLSTVATVIASQAVITGAFSIVRQAIQLGLLPRLEITHTSESQEGQIYIGRVNRLLLLGVLLLVIVFRSSSALASAYGIAVTGTMVVTTSLAFIVVWRDWKWPLWLSVGVIASFLTVDLAFLAANLLKIVDGGWAPLALGACSMIVMWTWVRGTRLLIEKTHRDSIPLAELIPMLEKSKPMRAPGTAIFLTNDPNVAPTALMHNIKHNKVLHERVLILCVRTENCPRVPPQKRFELTKVSNDFDMAILHFGYMESPRVPAALALMRKAGYKYDIMTTSFFLGRRTIKESPSSEMPPWQDKLYVALTKQSANATDFFSIPSDRVVELGAQVTI
ncbi:potassium transporter Kup [Methylocystis sp. MJC1]|jgi:KUP system potassium uptake protein|uniref:potassium transporter Kup n=1 Tax=Methylocystis sp. MJC1 TaxID=2654282 RepID=UPI0013EAE12E|nr:potassium transporter Kup [Methylocystis sp. MJC1]KAF2989812.1 Low affinity potassium transport system protein kup [Methylocystis sp. MJC1]MBU6526301.1 potassium transporter Kup [Methylocystis sp. MJC1]UZX12754.1 potassium transporter Kup [Methylocystis sp. MJC1]